jgi:site-specific DNA-methyltransferase (adenine-specific)
MQWLVRLVTPAEGIVLDPFAGTGSTLQAAQLAGFPALGIERDEFAYRLACVRLGREDPFTFEPKGGAA